MEDCVPTPLAGRVGPVVGRVEAVLEPVGITCGGLREEQRSWVDGADLAAKCVEERWGSILDRPCYVDAVPIDARVLQPSSASLGHPPRDFCVAIVEIGQVAPIEVVGRRSVRVP